MVGAREGTLICRSLLAALILAGSTGAVVAQDAARAGVDFGAQIRQKLAEALPQFLDRELLPELHEAWQPDANVKDEQTPAVALKAEAAADQAKAGSESTSGDNETAMSAARAAIKRQHEATRQAPLIRARAEALSRMFGAEPSVAEAEPQTETTPHSDAVAVADAAATPPASETAAPFGGEVATGALSQPYEPAQATGSISNASAGPEEAIAAKQDVALDPPPYAIGGPLPEAEPEAAVVTPVTAVTEPAPQSETVAPKRTVTLPPLPERAPQAVSQSGQTASTANSSGTRAPRQARPNPAYVFPNELRAFGWNSQP